MYIYAFKDINNTTSSSGGAFPAIISAIEEIEGRRPIVYGAAFDESFNVCHIRAVSENDYLKLRGSKYVKSKLGDSIQKVVSDLENGEVVIFSGTPCQVAALKNKVSNSSINSSKLYLIDIVCHGVPQRVVWQDFIKWLEKEYRSELTDFSFRYSAAKWKSYPTMAAFKNGKRIVNGFKLRRYTELFYKDLILTEACYHCKYANVNRPSDITIGDFWGIRSVIPEFPYKEEVSQVLLNSHKGKQVLSQLCNCNQYLLECVDFETARRYQCSFNQPTSKPIDTEQFWKDYSELPFDEVLKKHAGYNFLGKCEHLLKRLLGETGLLLVVKRILKV